MNFESIVQSVESLPPLSDTANTIRHLYANGYDDINIKKLIFAIESDAVLTANILKMINSPLYGFSKKITTIYQAVTLFGTQMIYGLVVKYAINSVVVANLRAYGITNTKFNDMCQLQSLLLNKWYTPIDKTEARFLTPLALIMESGKLVIAKEITQRGKIKDFYTGYQDAEDSIIYENSYFKTSSYYVSGLLFEHWNFEAHYIQILKGLDFEYSNSSPQLARWIDSLDVVRTAINVRETLTDKSINEAANLVFELGFSKVDFLKVVDKIKLNTINEL